MPPILSPLFSRADVKVRVTEKSPNEFGEHQPHQLPGRAKASKDQKQGQSKGRAPSSSFCVAGCPRSQLVVAMSKKYVPPHRRRSVESQGHDRKTHGNSPRRSIEDLEKSHRVLHDAIPKAYCINLASRTDKWKNFQRHVRAVSCDFLETIERFDAIDGSKVEADCDEIQKEWDSSTNAKYSPKETSCIRTMSPGEIGCALSHIALWRKLVASDHTYALILEDDCSFVNVKGGRDRFAVAFARAWKVLPSDWGIFYLGFSDRGERRYIKQCECITQWRDPMNPEIELFSPEYGYHTHAYMITKAAAQCLLDNLPVSGPVDVWLADHQWFGLSTYCAVIANEGWKLESGEIEGRQLIHQNRGKGFQSDVFPKR